MPEASFQSTHSRRITALQTALEGAGIYAAVLSRPQHIFYFCGKKAAPDPVFLVVSPRGAALVAPAAHEGIETVRYSAYDIYAGWSVAENAAQALEKALSAAHAAGRALGVEEAFLPARFQRVLHQQSADLRDLGDLLWELRKVREPGEVAQIEANEITNDQIFGGLRELIADGQSEFGLWSFIYESLCRAAGEPIQPQVDLGVGPRSAISDAKAGLALVQGGDTVFVDIYTNLHGYHADTTRVYSVGPASARQREIHGLLADALAAGEEMLRPGTRACDIDAAVRGVITRAGFGPNFHHHSGHATNIFQQDRPYFIPAETGLIEAGMVVTLEPGIYLPGWGGMRLEHNYLIGLEGARILDRFPIELVEC